PRIEGLFARIERWTDMATGISHWRSISKYNITTLYGNRDDARIADPADPTRVFTWRICESYDDKGNAALYQYKPEDASDIDQYMPPDGTEGSGDNPAFVLLAVLGNAPPTTVVINEMTTVASTWTNAQFLDGGRVPNNQLQARVIISI